MTLSPNDSASIRHVRIRFWDEFRTNNSPIYNKQDITEARTLNLNVYNKNFVII